MKGHQRCLARMQTNFHEFFQVFFGKFLFKTCCFILFIILNEFYEVVLRVVDLQAELLLLEIFEYRMNVVKGFVDILPDFGSSQDNLSRDKNE